MLRPGSLRSCLCPFLGPLDPPDVCAATVDTMIKRIEHAVRRGSHNHQVMLVFMGRHDRLVWRDIHVDLGAPPDASWDVNPGLDRESDARDDHPLLSRLEIVELWPGAVEIARIDRMAGPMSEIFSVSARFDHTTCHVVDLRAPQRLAVSNARRHELDRRIARILDGVPDL